jgi:hypothetical protein
MCVRNDQISNKIDMSHDCKEYDLGIGVVVLETESNCFNF